MLLAMAEFASNSALPTITLVSQCMYAWIQLVKATDRTKTAVDYTTVQLANFTIQTPLKLVIMIITIYEGKTKFIK